MDGYFVVLPAVSTWVVGVLGGSNLVCHFWRRRLLLYLKLEQICLKHYLFYLIPVCRLLMGINVL
ncbi:hypothetical protein BJY00DRAFT_98552 [Aspergillus carlsbadensis]|nr:hypothetical protein BJY00DRAFT_98552 [Aspergillus carlsbadensis]